MRLDGGWGVDALLGEVTRNHSDLDLVVARADAADVRARLERRGFAEDSTARPGLPARVVLIDPQGRQVDLHLIVHDTNGNGWQQLDDGTWGRYDAGGMHATGRIAGRAVACIGPELQLRHHAGYRWSEKDRADMDRLAARFRLALPTPGAAEPGRG